MFIFINGAVFGFKFLCGWSLCSFYAFLVLLLCNAPSQIDLAEYAHKCIAGKALSLFSISWHGVRCICLSSVVKIILQSLDFVFDFLPHIVDIVIKMNLAIHNKLNTTSGPALCAYLARFIAHGRGRIFWSVIQ